MSQPQSVWIISELYYPEETSTGYYMTRLAEGLASEFAVKVLCGQPTYSKRGTKAPSRETRNGVDIFRAAGSTLNKDFIPFRLINMATLGISILFQGLRRFRAGDLVLVVTTPPSMPFVVATASMIKGAAYVPLIHDNYPEILVAVGKTSENSLFVRGVEFLNRWLYKHASRIIVVGRDMADLVRRKINGLDVPVDTIPNWAELETVEPRPRNLNPLLQELGLEDKFVLLYAGNIGRPNDIETIVDVAADLRASDPQVHFIFLGTGAKKRWLERRLSDLQLTNVSLLAPRPRSEQIEFLNACDVALVSLVGKMRGVSMPSRTYNALAAGKPLIALTESGSELDQMIDEDDLGWVSPPGNVEALLEAIRCARNADLGEIGRRCRAVAVGKYSLPMALASYRSTLYKLGGDTSH